MRIQLKTASLILCVAAFGLTSCIKGIDPLPGGAACTQNFECISGSCANGVCSAVADGGTLDGPAVDGPNVDAGEDLLADTGNDTEADAGCACQIDGGCQAADEQHPVHACLLCVPAQSTTEWTVASNKCFIDGQCFDDGVVNSSNSCEACDPGFRRDWWMPEPDCVTTLAGATPAPTPEFSEGPFDQATFNRPYGIALDPDTFVVYVAGTFSHKISQLKNGEVTRITGLSPDGEGPPLVKGGFMEGTPIDARMAGPHAIELDPNGNLLVADRFNHRIRRFTQSNSRLDTLIGDVSALPEVAQNGIPQGTLNPVIFTQALFNNPTYISPIINGNFTYIVDQTSHSVRIVDWSATSIAVLVGSADGSNAVVNTANPGGPLGTGHNTRLNLPAAVAVDTTAAAGGHILYISDASNHRILKYDFVNQNDITSEVTMGYQGPGAATQTLASATFNIPEGLALDSTGKFLFVADRENSRIRLVKLDQDEVTVVAGSLTIGPGHMDGPRLNARFSKPTHIVLQGDKYLYICDWQNHRIRVLNVSTLIP